MYVSLFSISVSVKRSAMYPANGFLIFMYVKLYARVLACWIINTAWYIKFRPPVLESYKWWEKPDILFY